MPSAFKNLPAAASPEAGAGTLPAVPPEPVSPTMTGSVAEMLTVGEPASSAKAMFCAPVAAAGVVALKFWVDARVMMRSC